MKRETREPLGLGQERPFKILVYVLLALAIVWVGARVSFMFRPLVVLVSTLFMPILIAGFFYYLLNPLVALLERLRLPKVGAIIIVYIIIALVLALAILVAIPVLRTQLLSLMANTPRFIRATKTLFEQLQVHETWGRFIPEGDFMAELPSRIGQLFSSLYADLSATVTSLVSVVANVLVVLGTVPFVLFFMLKDGHRLPAILARPLPASLRTEASETLGDMSATLSLFIKGQMTVSAFVGVMVLIGYLVLGIDYALLLALVALVTNFIPYIGPIIGTVPGMLVGLMQGPSKMLQVLILVVIVQQVESQLISPLVMGKQLKIHPLVIVFALLVAGSLAGFLGLLVAVPAYAVARTAAVHGYKIFRLARQARSDSSEKS